MKRALLAVLLAGCIPVTYDTSTMDVAQAARLLRAGSSAVVPATESDDVDPDQPSWVDTTAEIHPSQVVRVRLGDAAFDWYSPYSHVGAEQPMTVADLLVDCPADASNNVPYQNADRAAHPDCKLFRTRAIQLRRGHRPDPWKIGLGVTVAATAGALGCAGVCTETWQRGVAGGVLIAESLIWTGVLVHALFSAADDFKHGYGRRD
jgi:hypothetical protein